MNLPHLDERENTVLATAILYQDKRDEIFETLTENDFYTILNKKIFNAIKNAKYPFDELDIKGDFTTVEYLTRLTPTSLAECLEFVEDLKICSRRRQAIIAAHQFIAEAEGPQVDNNDILLEKAKEISSALDYDNQEKAPLDTVVVEILEDLNKGKTTEYISTGYAALDNNRVAFGAGQLICIAARPRIGKSAFALNCAYNYAARCLSQDIKPKSTLFFSLEMDEKENVKRLLSIITGVNSDKLMYKPQYLSREDWQRLGKSVLTTSKLNLHIYENIIKLPEIFRIARKFKRKGELGAIYIDYLQLISPPKAGNREQEIAKITKELKNFAQNMNCPVIILAQLNREIEGRAGGRPMLSDLRESGSIEQDADKVIFLIRPIESKSAQDILTFAKNNNIAPVGADLEWAQKLTVVICAKNRQYRTCDTNLLWHGDTLTFTDEDNYNA